MLALITPAKYNHEHLIEIGVRMACLLKAARHPITQNNLHVYVYEVSSKYPIPIIVGRMLS